MISRKFSGTRLAVCTAAALLGCALAAQAQGATTQPGTQATQVSGVAALPSAQQAVGEPARGHGLTGPQPTDSRREARSEPLVQDLRYPMQAPQVRELQVRLRLAKHLALYDVDERFGMITRAAVLKFQRESGLRATGVVDPKTWSALLQRTPAPTDAELNNTDIGPWFVAPQEPGYMMELQHRLRQVGVYQGAVDGHLNSATRRAIEAWRVRMGLPASDVMDERTWTPLIARTRTPRYADLYNAPPASTLVQELDPRCATGKVVCVSKAQRKMSYVVDGKARFTREARFAGPEWDSPEGDFRVWYMNSDTVSKIFGERTPMPYAVFYDGNVAIHYSQDFADKGYEGGSHGCSQLRDYQVAKWLYEQLKVGDRVVVY